METKKKFFIHNAGKCIYKFWKLCYYYAIEAESEKEVPLFLFLVTIKEQFPF